MNEEWEGTITKHLRFKGYYEIMIESRSSIMVVFGGTSRGKFACIPNFGVGFHLSDLKDRFWNTERLVEMLGEVDEIALGNSIVYSGGYIIIEN